MSLSPSPETIAKLREGLPEMPADRRARFVSDYGLSDYDARILIADRAVADFFRWCDTRRVRSLEQISPTIVAGYIERRGADLAKPSVKQHLAAIRMLFDWLA